MKLAVCGLLGLSKSKSFRELAKQYAEKTKNNVKLEVHYSHNFRVRGKIDPYLQTLESLAPIKDGSLVERTPLDLLLRNLLLENHSLSEEEFTKTILPIVAKLAREVRYQNSLWDYQLIVVVSSNILKTCALMQTGFNNDPDIMKSFKYVVREQQVYRKWADLLDVPIIEVDGEVSAKDIDFWAARFLLQQMFQPGLDLVPRNHYKNFLLVVNYAEPFFFKHLNGFLGTLIQRLPYPNKTSIQKNLLIFDLNRTDIFWLDWSKILGMKIIGIEPLGPLVDFCYSEEHFTQTIGRVQDVRIVRNYNPNLLVNVGPLMEICIYEKWFGDNLDEPWLKMKLPQNCNILKQWGYTE